MQTQLEKCRQQIAGMLKVPDTNSWNTEDFEKLSDEILEKTGVQLSVSTLKRIWGKVNYNSSPSMATLNTLARFLNYENWRDFEQKNPAERTPVPVITPEPMKESEKRSGSSPFNGMNQPATHPATHPASRQRKIWVPALFGIVMALAVAFALSGFFRSAKKQPIDVKEASSMNPSSGSVAAVKFESRKTSDDLPNSVVFDYEAPVTGNDSVYIQQSWDPTRKEKVSAAGKQHTSLYYYPGYFNAKLIIDDRIQKESPVFIKTKGWKGIIEARPVPIYLTTGEIKGAGALGVSANTLRQKAGSPVFTNTWVDFFNVREFDGVDAGNFTLETVLKNTSTVEQSLCRKVRVTIIGKESAIIIPLSDKGCIADLQLLTGDRMISGKDRDLSAFGCNFSQFQHLSCQVKNGRLRVLLNGGTALDIPQAKTIGDIVGINIAFEGTGEIKMVSLGTPGKPIFQEKF